MDDQSDPQLRINKRAANEDNGPEMAAGAPQQRKILKMAPTKSHKKDVSTISTTCSRSFASVTASRGPHPEPSSSRRKSRRCDDDDKDDDDDNGGKGDTTLSGPKRANRIEDKSSNNSMHAEALDGLCDLDVYEKMLADVKNSLMSTTNKSSQQFVRETWLQVQRKNGHIFFSSPSG